MTNEHLAASKGIDQLENVEILEACDRSKYTYVYQSPRLICKNLNTNEKGLLAKSSSSCLILKLSLVLMQDE